jgi:hypothetical protein
MGAIRKSAMYEKPEYLPRLNQALPSQKEVKSVELPFQKDGLKYHYEEQNQAHGIDDEQILHQRLCDISGKQTAIMNVDEGDNKDEDKQL